MPEKGTQLCLTAATAVNTGLLPLPFTRCQNTAASTAIEQQIRETLMKYLVISSGLRPGSNSRTVAESLCDRLRETGEETEFLALSDHEMPFCDGTAYLDHPTTQLFREKVALADGIVLATPVYNYDANAAAKNFIEITGQAWQNKVVGFLCAAGGEKSYMSIMALANSLMLDFRCVIIPRFVYASGKAVADETVVGRIHELAGELVRFTTGLNSA